MSAGRCWALKEDILSRCLELQAVANTAKVHAVPGPAESQSRELRFDPNEGDARGDPCPDVDARQRPDGEAPAMGAGQSRHSRLGLLEQERVVVGAHRDCRSSRGIQAWEPLPIRARQELADIVLGQVVRRDVMTDGKEHVWCDIGLAGMVRLDDIGDDRGEITQSSQGGGANVQDCEVLVGPL